MLFFYTFKNKSEPTMLKYFTLVLLVLFNKITYSQSIEKTKYWIDENGKSVPQELFLDKWRSTDAEFARWDYVEKDSGRVAKASHSKLSSYIIDYPLFLKYINSITNKNLPDNTILLVEFYFKNDLCTSNISNKWGKSRIKNRKFYTDKWKKNIETKNPNLVYLVFFEKGIVVQNSNKNSEYYFSDITDLLRKKIFLDPTLCGSYLLSKPDGNTLVINGESTAEKIVLYLDPKIWDSLLFN